MRKVASWGGLFGLGVLYLLLGFMLAVVALLDQCRRPTVISEETSSNSYKPVSLIFALYILKLTFL